MKNLIALVLGVAVAGVGSWRLYAGDTPGGAAMLAVGLFLVYRGATGRVRQGL